MNTAHTRLRAPGERGAATLKTWRLVHRLRCCPQRGTNLVAAVLTLETATRRHPHLRLEKGSPEAAAD